MSGYLYFPNNLKGIKDHIQADMISCKIFFQLMVTVFKEKLISQLPHIFYGSIRLALETAFISEQIAENRFGALSEFSGKFITKFDVFSYMILQFRLKTVWKIYCSFTWKVILCTTKVRHELLEMGKDLKIKHSLSSPTPYKQSMGEPFSLKSFASGVSVETNSRQFLPTIESQMPESCQT